MQSAFQALASHPHLSRIIGDHDRPCGLEVWLLRIRVAGAENVRLLYGRVLPSDFVGNGWNGRSEDDFRAVEGDLQAEVARINLFATTKKATAFLIALASGRSFADANVHAGIAISSALKGRYDALVLNDGLRVRPAMHLPSRDYYRFESARLSPAANVSAASAALVCLNKSGLFRVGDSSFPKLAAFASERLSHDTGMEFQDLDAWRLGDFELLVLPAKDDQERDTVSVRSSNSQVVIEIDRPLVEVPLGKV